MAPNLRRSISWTLAGKVVYAACQWAALLVLARMGGLEAVGRFTLALAVTGPLMLLGNLSLRNVQATLFDDRYTYADFVAVRAWTTALALLAVVAVLAVSSYSPPTALVIALVAVAKAFEAMSDVVQGLEQVQHRLDLAARSTMVRGVAGVAALALGYRLGGGVATAVAAMTAAWAATYFFYDRRAERRLLAGLAPVTCPRPRLARRLQLVRLALPMGAVALLIALNSNIPRYFIASELGEAALGEYAAMAYFVVIGSVVINGLGQAALVPLAEHHAGGRRVAFRRLLGRLTAASLALGLAGVGIAWLFGQVILEGFYGPAFARDPGVFVWVMFAGAASYAASALFYGVTARRIFAGQAALYAAVTLVHAAGCALLSGAHGVRGAIWAGLAATAVQLLLSVCLLAPGRDADDRRRR